MNRREWLVVLIALVSGGMYLVFAAWRGAVGFPLDDAWIHQVYARNLGLRFDFAFFAGQPSAGSTSPLWSLLLAFSYLFHIDFRVWVYLLGIVLLGLSALVATRLARRLFPDPLLPFYVSLFILFEWHLVWSAVSGMEILLFVFLSLILLERFYAGEKTWRLGVLAGLLSLARPEGAVLAVLVAFGIVLQNIEPPRFASQFAIRNSQFVFRISHFVLAFLIVLAPYLLFNFAATGAIFPNTFYAKAAEYAELFERTPLVFRWLDLLWTPFVGAQILLIPGLLYGAIALALKRQWHALIPLAWILILPALYAVRLPVTYQHGRYEMPMIPFIVVYGLWGTVELFARLRIWVIRTGWGLSIAAVLIVFWLVGAAQYATDVAIVNCEMVQSARWVAANVPSDAVVAAHDIGALGYFYNRSFIDLAGLVSPEVIPFIRDESRLQNYLFARNTNYVVVFPDWYATLAGDSRFVPAFQTNCAVTRNAGEKNMIVYRIVK